MKYELTLSGGSLEQRNTGAKFGNKNTNDSGIKGFTKNLLKSNIIINPVL